MRIFLCWFAGPVAALILLVGARMCLFTVDRAEYVYVTQFGRHIATYDGADAGDAGLHWKWPAPIQSIHRLDRRLQVFDLPARELPTNDPEGRTIDKMLTLDAYVCWRISGKDGVDRFLKTVGTPEQAQAILGQRIESELGAAVSRMKAKDLISTETGRVDAKREDLRQSLLRSCKSGPDYGIEVMDVRLRRANHPPEVREAIFRRIRSERERRAADYTSEGVKAAADIASKTKKEVDDIKADAEAEKKRIQGEADTEADRIRNEAHGKDVEFYAFLKKLEEYQNILGDNKSMLLISTHREMFKLLFEPPAPDGKPVPLKSAGSEGGKKP
jgi:membrane protease subunit HflC